MDYYITDFLIPVLSVLTSMLLGVAGWFMLSNRKHESRSQERHIESISYSRSMQETLKKVDKDLTEKVIPTLGDIYQEKGSDLIGLNPDSLMGAINKIGASAKAVTDDGGLLVAGWHHKGQNVYFMLLIDSEDNDLMIEAYSNMVTEINYEALRDLLQYNDTMKVSGVAIEEIKGIQLVKTQYMIDAPDGNVNFRTLDFAMNSLMEGQVQIRKILENRNIKYEFFPPEEYFKLRLRAKIPNKKN